MTLLGNENVAVASTVASTAATADNSMRVCSGRACVALCARARFSEDKKKGREGSNWTRPMAK
jgi:hypothetical protein